ASCRSPPSGRSSQRGRKIVGRRSDIPCSTSACVAASSSARPCHSAEKGGPARAQGTESSQTRRWREVDSNHRSRPAIATELRYVRARCVPTANGCQFHTAPVKWPNQLQLRLASNREKLGGKAMTEKTVRPHSVLRRTML